MRKVQGQSGLLKTKTGGRAQEERRRLRVSGRPRTESIEGTVKPKSDGHLYNMSPVLGALHAYLAPENHTSYHSLQIQEGICQLAPREPEQRPPLISLTYLNAVAILTERSTLLTHGL